MTDPDAPAGQRRASSTHVISITPFDEDGRVDEPALRAHLRRMAAAGVGVYLGGGGSGEGFTLSPEEARFVLEIGADEIGGQVPVRSMGIEPRTATQMIEYVEMSRQAGVDAAQIYSLEPGHGHRPSPAEVEAYLTEVVDSTTFPCVISTHQSVGYRIDVALLADLVARHDHVIGVNCSHQDVGYLAALVDALDGRADVHVGGPLQALTALALGAQGFLSSEANLAPVLCSTVIAAHRAGDLEEAFGAFGVLARLSGRLYGNGGIRATKAVLNRLGLPGGIVRAPQLLADDATVDRLVAWITEQGLPATEGW